MRKKAFICLCGGLLLFMAGGRALYAEETADAVMQAYYALPELKSMSGTTYMVLREADNRTTTREIRMATRKTKQGTDSYSEFLSPADVQGTRFLTIGNDAGDDDQRLWLPDLGKIRKIAASGKSGKFMGSDLTYYDMESHHFDDASYKMLREEPITYTKDGEKQARACWVIESTLKDNNAPYSRQEVWVSQEDHFIYKTRAYDRKGNVDKDIYITEAQTYEGVILPIKTLVANPNGHKTLLKMVDLKINADVSDDLFTIQNLQK